jgi:hypothetical protein
MGPGHVLTGLIRKIQHHDHVTVAAVGVPEDMESVRSLFAVA